MGEAAQTRIYMTRHGYADIGGWRVRNEAASPWSDRGGRRRRSVLLWRHIHPSVGGVPNGLRGLGRIRGPPALRGGVRFRCSHPRCGPPSSQAKARNQNQVIAAPLARYSVFPWPPTFSVRPPWFFGANE